jgi:hypothetical protein
VRAHIVAQPGPKVGAEVVPVLTEALKTARGKHERLALIKALGELGPAAKPSVGLLCERLKKSDDAGERLAVLVALDQMGPAAREAEPTLVAFTSSSAPARTVTSHHATVKAVSLDKKYAERFARVTPTEEQYARQVLSRLNGREAQVGVFDKAGLFSLKGTIDTTRALRKLARESGLEVRVETHPGQPSAASPRLGPVALRVVITSGGDAVEVLASPALREQGVEADGLKKQLGCCKHDQALDLVLDAVKKAKK